MTAVVASSSAEWEMVYMVSCVAMPTITALVVMLARWKGKKPSAEVPNLTLSGNPTHEKLTGEEVKGRVPCSGSLRKRNAQARAERNEQLIRRVTSCPDFAVVRVVKASGKVPRQLSFTNLKDRKLQDEIAKLADRLLNSAEQNFEGERKSCGWNGAETRGLKVSKFCPWRAKLRAEQRTQGAQRREAGNCCTKGSRCEEEGVLEGAVVEKDSASVRRQKIRNSKVEEKVQTALDTYGRMWPDLCNLVARKTCSNSSWGAEECSIVKYWGQPEVIEQSYLSWSVDSLGIVESWDSRAGHMPTLSHCMALASGRRSPAEVEGLNVTGWQLRIRLACGRDLEVDGRKLLNGASV